MPDHDIIDEQVFRELVQNVGADFIGELIGTYLTDAPGLLADMQKALEVDNADAFRRAAHSFKSNSATFGAAVLSAQAKELEMIAKSGSLDGAAPKLAELEVEYEKVRDQLRELE